MYRYYVPKRAPLSFWMLDDTYPFLDDTGMNASATKKAGTTDPTFSVSLVPGAAFSTVFKAASVGQFSQNVFKVGLEARPFALEAWVLPIPKTTTGDQQILSHGTIFDGLSINGKVVRFGTSYATSGDAFCTFDLQEYQLAHVVGIHNSDVNQLWVNGELVSSVQITDAQKADTYVAAADGTLYAGYTTANSELAMNGVAIYASISGDGIYQNWAAGNDYIGQARVAPQYSGLPMNLDRTTGSVFLDVDWIDKSDFSSGLKDSVEFGEDAILPSYVAGVSVPGTWTVGIPLDAQADTSIYGVMVQWSGIGITVATSLDGTTWTTAKNGELISTITSGYNPTGKDLQVRVSFAGGLASDPSYLESLRVIGFRDNNINNLSTRTVTASYPAVVREDYEPTTFRDDNGINLHGGTLTIGPDTTVDPQVARTLELWIKPLSGTPTIAGGTFTKYRNGAADTTLPIGEWSLIEYVASADMTGSITVTGDAIVGQATLYPTALSPTEVANIYKSYTGALVQRYTETQNTLTVSESATPTQIYAHDWSIDSAG
jgi:hypothetical protein